jgi:hypothetical protein
VEITGQVVKKEDEQNCDVPEAVQAIDVLC